MSELNWKGGNGNTIAVTDDGAVYSIQTVANCYVLQAISPEGVGGMGGTGFLGTSLPTLDTAKMSAQMIEDER